jgi:hypothetical protein
MGLHNYICSSLPVSRLQFETQACPRDSKRCASDCQLFFRSLRYGCYGLHKQPEHFIVSKFTFDTMYVSDILQAIMQFKLMEYIAFWNIVDLSHFAIMWFGWSLWLAQVWKGQSLNMPARFGLLFSAGPDTPARYFRTDPSKEYDFLMFSQNVEDIASNWTLYSIMTSLSGVFLFKFSIPLVIN